MQVQVLPDSYREFTSKDKTHRFQEVFVKWAHEPFPRPCSIYLTADSSPYQPGLYELDVEKSIRIRADKLQFGDLVLKPVKIDNSKGGA